MNLELEHLVLVLFPTRPDPNDPARRWRIAFGAGPTTVVWDEPQPTLAAARHRGLAVWHARLQERIERIREARGGTLAWGVPVEPPRAPQILELTAVAGAWDPERAAGPAAPNSHDENPPCV